MFLTMTKSIIVKAKNIMCSVRLFSRKKLFIWSITSIFIFFLSILYLVLKEDNIKPIDFITGLSSITIVFLTASYVMVTSGQLNVMSNQLEEMKRNRMYTSQPLPLLEIQKVCLEKPRLFFSPPSSEYDGHSRLQILCSVKNHGNSPILSADCCACLKLPNKKNRSETFTCAGDRINIIPNDNQSRDIDFMFIEDHDGKIINSLRSLDIKEAPFLTVCITYKNILGACFQYKEAYQLFYDYEKQDSILENWSSMIAAFDSMLKQELSEIKQISHTQKEWDDYFEKMREKYEKNILGEDQYLKAWQIPSCFSLEPISKEEYDSKISKTHYGHLKPPDYKCLSGD